MSCEVGLSIGESFAELVAFQNEGDAKLKPFFQTRWYLPRKSLVEGLKEALRTIEAQAPDGGVLRVASDSVTRILEKSQGRAPAVLVTTGFESWLSAQQAPLTPPFTLRAKRGELPTEDDFVFGLAGRIAADGSVVTPLASEDIEFLAAKLELLKIKDVAITLLNAHRNPEHELQVAANLRERGLRVFCSHKHLAAPSSRKTEPTQEERWRATLESAFAESSVLEEKEQLETAIKSATGTWTTEVWTNEGVQSLEHYSAATIRHGLRVALDRNLSERTKDPRALTLHCALDVFCVLGVHREGLLPIRPTAHIRYGPWPFPSICNESTGYAPGSMALGKSQQLAILDILYVRDRLLEVEGLTALLSEKTRSRILESLFTIAKRPTNPGAVKSRAPDAAEIAIDLEKAFVERCAINLSEAGMEKTVNLSGPLAASVKPLLAARRPDLKIISTPAMAWLESFAVAGRSVEVSK